MRRAVLTEPDVEKLTQRIIGCAIAVHRELGPGLLESVYTECLSAELCANGLVVERERQVPIRYRGSVIATRLKIDMLIDRLVIVEVKATDRVHPVHLAQLITYLKLADKPAGLLMNFNECSLRAGLRRAWHPNLRRPRSVRS